MKLLPTALLGSLSLLGLPLLADAASSASSLDSKLSKFHTLAAKSGDGVVYLNSAQYDELIGGSSASSPPRNYSVSVILTALNPKFGCKPCQAFDKEHKLVASQWWNRRENKKSKAEQMRHVFAVLDFEKGQEIFKRMGLNTAPLGQLFLPAKSEVVPYDFNRQGPSAENFANFLAQNTGLPIAFSRPVDYTRAATSVTALVAAISVAFFFWSYVKVFLLSRYLWAFASLAFILPMISGHMWNQIRHPPYMQVSKDGKPNYIAGGYSNQFGVETQIISVLYGLLAFSAYTLTVTLPNMSHDKFRQRVGVYLWTIVLVLTASVLVAIFSIKNPGYPFRLLF